MKHSLDMSYSPWYYAQYLYNEMKRSLNICPTHLGIMHNTCIMR